MRLSSRPRQPAGFTLVELMVVVAIIGILAAIAIPRFLDATYRSRRAERESLSRNLMRSLQTYYIEKPDTLADLLLGDNPSALTSAGAVPFERNLQDWGHLPFQPEGRLWHRYSVTFDTSDPTQGIRATIGAIGDLDRDGDDSLLERDYAHLDGTITETAMRTSGDDW